MPKKKTTTKKTKKPSPEVVRVGRRIYMRGLSGKLAKASGSLPAYGKAFGLQRWNFVPQSPWGTELCLEFQSSKAAVRAFEIMFTEPNDMPQKLLIDVVPIEANWDDGAHMGGLAEKLVKSKGS